MQLMYYFQPTLMFNISSFNLVPAKKVFVFGVILVPIFLTFTRIWTEYGGILRISPYSVQMRQNAGKMRTRRTQNTDTYYAVSWDY